MKKKFVSLCVFSFYITCCFSQIDTLRGEEARKLSKEILKQINIDSTKFLTGVSNEACKCIDSIKLRGKSSKEITVDIAKCIDKQVAIYQFQLSILKSMTESVKDNTLYLNLDKNSAAYKDYYFTIERWLNDSCTSLKNAAAVDNKESANSMSENEMAMSYYNKGIRELNTENYKAALPFFESAVALDEKFAFAWDNLGICKRRLQDFDGALSAYYKSLELDPKGKTPLQNIPVVYELKKEYDKALEAYQQISKIYPDDPEALYGAGRIYDLKNDTEKALDFMCKAYNAYIAINSPYRTDAEKIISILYKKMKDAGKEERFFAILKDNNIKPN